MVSSLQNSMAASSITLTVSYLVLKTHRIALMKKIRKIMAGLLLFTALLLAAGIIYITTALPDIPAPEIALEATPEMLERGEYLANNVMGCTECHSQRDWSKFTGPVKPATHGIGGEKWGRELGLPGEVYAPNITSYHLADWTDGEIYRAITAGVSKDGSPLFPVMPYANYGSLAKEDIYAVIAYLRTLEAVPSEPHERELEVPVNIVVHLMPAAGSHELQPSDGDIIARGRYMATAASCADCHTPRENAGLPFSGGTGFPLKTGGTVYASNITPHNETGIGRWTEAQFVRTFKQYADSGFVAYDIKPGQFNSYMPWTCYAGIKEEDLKAIYAYLMSVEPVENRVTKFETDQPVALSP